MQTMEQELEEALRYWREYIQPLKGDHAEPSILVRSGTAEKVHYGWTDYREVGIQWTKKWDTRAYLLIDGMSDEERRKLCTVEAQKGHAELSWWCSWHDIPERFRLHDTVDIYEDGEFHDCWTFNLRSISDEQDEAFERAYGTKPPLRIVHDIDDLTQMEESIRETLPNLPYHAYLKSNHWQRMRELAFEYYGEACSFCNETSNLNVHHRTYARKGSERLTDLAVFCRDCHAKLHDKAS